MKTTIYFSQCKYTLGNKTVFVPTSQTVQERYLNGDVGDQLWEQLHDNEITGNLWTEREILSLNPTSIQPNDLLINNKIK